jgi:hypothetical protein
MPHIPPMVAMAIQHMEATRLTADTATRPMPDTHIQPMAATPDTEAQWSLVVVGAVATTVVGIGGEAIKEAVGAAAIEEEIGEVVTGITDFLLHLVT